MTKKDLLVVLGEYLICEVKGVKDIQYNKTGKDEFVIIFKNKEKITLSLA